MNRTLLAISCLFGAGVALVIGEIRWFRREPLFLRLEPHARNAPLPASRTTSLTNQLSEAADRVSRFLDSKVLLKARLERIHSTQSPSQFRARQMAFTAVTLAIFSVVAALVNVDLFIRMAVTLVPTLLVFLQVEKHSIDEAEEWRKSVDRDLPLVVEQIGMYVGAGDSLTTSFRKLRVGSSPCAKDIDRLCSQLEAGSTLQGALTNWEMVSGSSSVKELNTLLRLDSYGPELSTMLAERAHAMRREQQRKLIELLERRSQQVWIPVTVATLVPGSILLAIPFIDAISTFTK